MDFSSLGRLGMTHKEVRVYLKLLELGPSGANSLSQRLDENRTSTYSLLLSLQKKGFVSYVKKYGVKHFVPSDPSMLIQHFSKDAKHLRELLPQLLAMYNSPSRSKPIITFYEGVSGIKQIGELLLQVPGSTRCGLMTMEERNIHPEIKRYYEEEFINRRIELGITFRGIVGGILPMGNKYPATEKGQLRELKHIDPQKFPIKIHVDIFPPDSVALYSYHKDDLMGVVIQHESFHRTLKTLFDLAWLGIEEATS